MLMDKESYDALIEQQKREIRNLKRMKSVTKKEILIDFRNLAFNWFGNELGWKSFIDAVNKKFRSKLHY